MNKIIRNSLILLFIDIVVKIIIKNCMNLYDSIKVINNFFYITYVKNVGAAFSILSGRRIFLILFSVCVIVLLFIYIAKKKKYSNMELISYSMIIAGAVGNLIDRIVYGYVIDYIDIYIFSYNYPVFNIADICIVLGIVLLFIEKR